MRNKFKKLYSFIIVLICFSSGSAQNIDSTRYSQPLKFKPKQLIIPTGLLISGIAFNGKNSESIKNEIVEERNEAIPRFRTRLDDYLQFSPLVLTYSFEAFGMKPKTDISNRTVILAKSEIIMLASVLVLKSATHTLRPDGSAYTSFPSGHTAQAFSAATLLSEEYGYRYKWVPYVSYGLASGIGGLRIANNKHYVSDVLVAAAIGILSTKIAYWTHRYKWGKKN